MEGRAVIESIHKRIGHIVVPYKYFVLVWSGFVGDSHLTRENPLAAERRRKKNEVTSRAVRSTYCPADIVWFYNCHNGMWKPAQTTGSIPEKTSGSSAAVLDDYLYIFGGMVEFGEESLQRHRNYLHRLHLPSLKWEKLLPRGPAPPSSDKGVGWAFGGKIYFFGGYGPRPDPSTMDFVFHADFNNTNGRMGWNNNLFAYDPAENKWSKPNTRGRTPDPRAAHAASIMGNRAFIFGGRLGDTRTNDMYYLNMDTFTWSQNLNVPSKGPEGRSWLSFSFVARKKAVVYGGLRQYGIAAMDYWECKFSEDYESLEWTKCVSPIEPRVWHQAAFCEFTGELVIIGGVSKSPYEMEEEDIHRYKVKMLEFDSERLLGSPSDAMDVFHPVGFNFSETPYRENNLSISDTEESLPASQSQLCPLGDHDSSVAEEESPRAAMSCHTCESPAYNPTRILNVTYDIFTKFSNEVSTSSPRKVDLIGYNNRVETDSYDGLNNADATAVTSTIGDDEDITQSGGEHNEPQFVSADCPNSPSDYSICDVAFFTHGHELFGERDSSEYCNDKDTDSLEIDVSRTNSIFETNLNNSFGYLETGQNYICIPSDVGPGSNLVRTVCDSSYISSELSYYSTIDSSFGNENLNDCRPSSLPEPAIATPITHVSEFKLLIGHCNKYNFEETMRVPRNNPMFHSRTNNMHSDYGKLNKIKTTAYKEPHFSCVRVINFNVSSSSGTPLDSDYISPENTYDSNSDALGPDESAAARPKGTVSSNDCTAEVGTAAARTHGVPEIQVPTDHLVYSNSPANQMLPSETSNLQRDTASFKTCSSPHKRCLYRNSSPVMPKTPTFQSYITPENFSSENIMRKCTNSEGMVSELGTESSKSGRPTSHTLETPRNPKHARRLASEENSVTPSLQSQETIVESTSSKGTNCKTPSTKPSEANDKNKFVTAATTAAKFIVKMSPLVKTACVAAGTINTPGQFLTSLSIILSSTGRIAKATDRAFHDMKSVYSSPNKSDQQ